ncbi:transporter [Tamilnaduibacter salinus]|uniref:Transporter n=1 Tax=Tamilnaduibacter salinus TaxID=1484056 RepID=A0A2A2I0C3_9GAMM|nr:potassium channel family protein [Tamilnaduibacter salinus]PAV24756.1 transporter [Tamilnaduibacter salinus]
MLILKALRRPSRRAMTRHIQVDMGARLRRVLGWLLLLSGLHVVAMTGFESLGVGDAVWLTLTTLTTVGYGDFSATTAMGRLATTGFLYLAGITLMAQLASDYIDYRLKRKDDMIQGRWRWQMQDHLLIINSPNRNPDVYFRRLLDQLKATREFADTPVQILTDGFPDGLPAGLREQGVVHHHGDATDPEALAAVTPALARAIIVLAADEDSRTSDSVTLDVLMQIDRQCDGRQPLTVAECVTTDNRERAERLGASSTLRPIRAYPEMLVRALVARGSEKVLENLFTHHDDHPVRYEVTLENVVWADVACRLLVAGMGTLMAYITEDEEVVCHPAHDHRFSARALIVMVREEAIPDPAQVDDCIRGPMPDLPVSAS